MLLVRHLFICMNRSISYYIREIYHICVTVNIVVAATQQTWAVFIALSEVRKSKLQ